MEIAKNILRAIIRRLGGELPEPVAETPFPSPISYKETTETIYRERDIGNSIYIPRSGYREGRPPPSGVSGEPIYQDLLWDDLRDYERAFLKQALARLSTELYPAEFVDARLTGVGLFVRLRSGHHGQLVLIVPDVASDGDIDVAYRHPSGEYLGPWVVIRESEIVAIC